MADRQTDGAQHIRTVSLKPNAGGTSEKLSVDENGDVSAAIKEGSALVSVSDDVYYRCDADPTATNDGTDQILFAGGQYRIAPITAGYKLAFKAPASGTSVVHITPGA